jgi:hypothetical protein
MHNLAPMGRSHRVPTPPAEGPRRLTLDRLTFIRASAQRACACYWDIRDAYEHLLPTR